VDAIELLVWQHREVEASMERLVAAAGNVSAGVLLADVGDAFALHVTSEEQVFYPAVLAARARDIPPESLAEHVSLKSLIADLLALDTAERTFAHRLEVLTEQIAHHHREEEELLFPKVQRLIAAAHREALGMEMLALRRYLERVGTARALVAQQVGFPALL
jgi:hypothetical protein